MAGDHADVRQVGVAGANAVAVLDFDQFSITAGILGEVNYPVRGGLDRRTRERRNIDTGVECTFARERIAALRTVRAERMGCVCGDLSPRRGGVRDRVQAFFVAGNLAGYAGVFQRRHVDHAVEN